MKQLSFAVLALTASLSAQNACITLSNIVDGYVEVPYSPAVVPQSGITVEAWIMYDDATIGPSWRYPTVVRQNRNAGQESYFLRVEAGNNNNKAIRWLVNANSIMTIDWPFTAGQLTTWTHVAGTWDGQTSRLFINGVEVGSRLGSGPLRDQGDVLRIGKGSDIGTPLEVWNGSIDEVRIWPFARTAAEISSTMSLALTTIPGDVSTWSFDNHLLDLSSGRHAVIGGAVSYSNSAPALTSQFFPGVVVGASTVGCNGAISATTTAIPMVGNQGFAIVAQRFPGSTSAVAVLGLQTLPAPFPILGVDIWMNPAVLIGGFTAAVSPLGVARLGLPIPASIPNGATLAAQFVAIDACGPQGLTASDAIVFSIL